MLASKRHTLIVLLIFGVVAFGGYLANARGGTTTAPVAASRIPFYVTIVVTQLLLVRYVVVGIRARGFSLVDLIGERRLLDIVIASALFFVLRYTSFALRNVLHLVNDHTSAIIPRGAAEFAMWTVVSIVAGFSEEIVFRGYLQRQFAAMSGSAAAGVVLQAIVFGASHGYQGIKSIINITILGLIFGVVAWWRRSVTPGIVAHAVTDMVGGIVR
jgi:membrane protease YdiL (CAAX protease family)